MIGISRARAVMNHYGARIVEEPSELEIETGVRDRWTQLFRGPLLSQSLAISLLAVGVWQMTERH